MNSGYHQVEKLEEHKERTVFTAGLLQLLADNQMPIDLACVPATYQRLMQDCLRDIQMRICCIFVDDVIIVA